METMALELSPEQAGFSSDTARQLILQSAIIKLMQTVNKQSREQIADLEDGTTVTVKGETALGYGKIVRNKLKRIMEPTDPELLDKENPGIFRDGIDLDHEEAIVELIKKHGTPNMLKRVANDAAFAEAQKQALLHYENTGNLTPGWELHEKHGTISVRPSDEATMDALEYARSVGMVL